jgi:hypothetical protein
MNSGLNKDLREIKKNKKKIFSFYSSIEKKLINL